MFQQARQPMESGFELPSEYTCMNVHTHTGSFHDNKDLGATAYQQCIESTQQQRF